MTFLQRVRREDRGVTLAELVVSMGVMAVVMTIFTTGILQMYRISNASELVTTTQSQLTTAFLRLDRELRYAKAVGPAHASGADKLIEYVITENGVGTCVQLKLAASAGTLLRDSWPQTATQKFRWQTLATDVDVAASSLTRKLPGTESQFQGLTVLLVVGSGTGDRAVTASTEVTFTALNSRRDIDDSLTCPSAR